MYQTQRQARAFIPSPLRDAIQPIWVVATSVWLVGCTTPPLSNSLWGTAPPPTPVELAPAHPRPLAAGSVWVYDKGTVKRLLAVEQAHWVWETQTDTGTHIHHSTPDFFAPALWQKDGRVVSTIDGQPAALWPLSAGRTVVFRETRMSPPLWGSTPREQVLNWRCEVQAATVVYAPVGDYPSWPVRCSAQPAGWPAPTERITWDYAPALGQAVRVVWFENGRQRGSWLYGALPGPAASPEALDRLLARVHAPKDTASPDPAPPNRRPGPAP